MTTPTLVYVNDKQAGFTRKRRGRGFTYLNKKGRRIEQPKLLKRINSLSIPPAWQQVWICVKENGHLQATGRDEKGRKQYIYHAEWQAARQQMKFDKMRDFAVALPEFRKVMNAHLRLPGWPREKVLALIIKIIENYHIRIGNEKYKKQNGTFGLTTLRRKHLDIYHSGITFYYKAKSNKYREIKIDHKKIRKLIRECSALPGYEVFRYQLDKNRTEAIDSHDVNEYIHTYMGDSFSSKDFRTWAGTTLAVQYYDVAKQMTAADSKKKLIPTLVKLVATDLGNTQQVCRDYYIHPRVLKQLERKDPLSPVEKKQHKSKQFSKLAKHERITCLLMKK